MCKIDGVLYGLDTNITTPKPRNMYLIYISV
jgi:hypothetical protein